MQLSMASKRVILVTLLVLGSIAIVAIAQTPEQVIIDLALSAFQNWTSGNDPTAKCSTQINIITSLLGIALTILVPLGIHKLKKHNPLSGKAVQEAVDKQTAELRQEIRSLSRERGRNKTKRRSDEYSS